MPGKAPTRILPSRSFLLRVLLGYLLIPLIPPILLMLATQGGPNLLSDRLGVILVYGVFGLAAMLMLGSPLLFVFLRRVWTGFVNFMCGAALCAFITSYAMLRGQHNQPMIAFFTVTGLVSGFGFRIILFGFDPVPKS
jgi:hypothetical protein